MPQLRQPGVVRVAMLAFGETIENIVVFEIAVRRHVVMAGEIFAVIAAQHLEQLVITPDVELALLAFRIGIERGGEGALLRRHFAREPTDRLARALREQQVAAAPEGQRQQLQQLRVVVQHLLEMRHQPALVDRIAREAAAEMVVDAALAHALERVLDGLEEALVAGAQPGPPEHFQDRRLRKLGRAAQAAVDAGRTYCRSAPPRHRAPSSRWSPCLPAAPFRTAAPASASRFCAILPGSSLNSRDTSRSTSTKAGRPKRLSFGKYVPPHTGSPAGVRNIVSGQPPCSPSRCSAFM